MSKLKIDVADLDCIYLSYDEPQKEEFWVKIKNMIPWARRVDGVKGSDAAHKAAAQASDTERFILIDGDNMPDMEFFNLTLDFTDKDEDFQHAQYRWRAVNAINGLRYGNGGMSSMDKRVRNEHAYT
jgi:arylsulfatase A-like enzyme